MHFPLISISPENKGPYKKSDQNLTITKLKRIIHNCGNKETMKIISSFETFKSIYQNAICRYQERYNDKVLKFHMNKFFFFEISASLKSRN